MTQQTLLRWIFLLRCLHSTASIDDNECPFLCDCVKDASTSAVNVTCEGSNLLPSAFPTMTKHIVLRQAKLEVIPAPNVFSGLKSLSTISFIDSTIATIRACSFAQLQHVDSITFRSTTIETIQGNSFSNLENVTSINIIDSNIGGILSYAFHNIKGMELLLIQGSLIRVIHPLGFQDFGNVENIKILESTINRFLVIGFSDFDDVRNLVIGEKTKILELQCETFQTVLNGGGQLDVTNSLFTCNCTLAWMWALKDTLTDIFTEPTNQCLDPSVAMSTLGIDDVCPDVTSRKKGCPPLLPSTPHICSQGFDEMEPPVSKVAYPTLYPTTPSGANNINIALTFVAVLCLFISVLL